MSQSAGFYSLLPQAGEGLGMRGCRDAPSVASDRQPSPQPLSRLRARGLDKSSLDILVRKYI
jgi:hypothetical protein